MTPTISPVEEVRETLSRTLNPPKETVTFSTTSPAAVAGAAGAVSAAGAAGNPSAVVAVTMLEIPPSSLSPSVPVPPSCLAFEAGRHTSDDSLLPD
jgi:hypothetical protein